MIRNDHIIPQEFMKYDLPEDVIERLIRYYEIKESYINKKSERIDLIMTYEPAYEDIKLLMHRGIIPEDKFEFFIDLLQEGLNANE